MRRELRASERVKMGNSSADRASFTVLRINSNQTQKVSSTVKKITSVRSKDCVCGWRDDKDEAERESQEVGGDKGTETS